MTSTSSAAMSRLAYPSPRGPPRGARLAPTPLRSQSTTVRRLVSAGATRYQHVWSCGKPCSSRTPGPFPATATAYVESATATVPRSKPGSVASGAGIVAGEEAVHLADGLREHLEGTDALEPLHVLSGLEREAQLHPTAAAVLHEPHLDRGDRAFDRCPVA